MLIQSPYVKIQVYCPKDSEEIVRKAIGDAGGGRIGKYDHCISVTESTGYFRPLEGSHPAIGAIGRIERVAEVKLEFICEEYRVEPVLAAVREVHPYEEIAFDITPLLMIDA